MKIDWENVTNYLENVGSVDKVFSFPKAQSAVQITNRGSANLIYTIGSQSGTLTPTQSVKVTETISSFTLRSSSGSQLFECWGAEAGTEQDEPETDLASLASSLAEKVSKVNGVLPDSDGNVQIEGLPTALTDGQVTPIKTSFMTPSENLINPANRQDGYFLKYGYNTDIVGSYSSNATGTVYNQTFPAVSGDIYYSNSPGRLVWYGSGSSGLVKGNTTFTLDSTLGLYKATVGSGGTQIAFDGYISNINIDGYWFICKSTSWSGTKSPFGSSNLYSNVGSPNFGKQTDITSLQTRATNLETPTSSLAYFVPHYLYCFDSVKNSKYIPKWSVMTARNYNNFYMDCTAGWGYNRDWERIFTQDTDTITIKNSVSGAAYYSKQYVRRNAIPANKTNPSTQKNVLIIGDSYTDYGYIPTDIKNQLVNTYGYSNLNFIGTNSDTLNGVTCANEGHGGYTIDDFTKTDNTQGRGTTYPNPFLINGTVNFATYMSTNGYSGNLDYVIIELGVNNLVALSQTPATIKTKMQGLIDLILASYPNCKIFVAGLVMLSKINAQKDCVTHNTSAMSVNQNYETLCESSPYNVNCYYVDTACFFDSDNGFQYSYTPYRGSTDSYKVQTDWLHPSQSGYFMLTDTIVSAFIYNM